MKRLDCLIESMKRLKGHAAPLPNSELITVSREELKQCLEATLEDAMCNGGVLSQLIDQCMALLKKRKLCAAVLKNHDV
jgi:hypothetical protein